MNETTKVEFGFTSSAKFPSMSVIVPLVVPFSTTFAPATGPNSSSTIPLIVYLACCGEATTGLSSAELSVPVEGLAEAIPIDAKNMEVPKNIALDT